MEGCGGRHSGEMALALSSLPFAAVLWPPIHPNAALDPGGNRSNRSTLATPGLTVAIVGGWWGWWAAAVAARGAARGGQDGYSLG